MPRSTNRHDGRLRVRKSAGLTRTLKRIRRSLLATVRRIFCMARDDFLEFAPHAFGESDGGRSPAETAIAADEARAGEEAQLPTTLSAATEFATQYLTVGRSDAFEQNLPRRCCVMVRTAGDSPWLDRGRI